MMIKERCEMKKKKERWIEKKKERKQGLAL